MKKIVVVIILVIVGLALYISGLLSFQGLCGFKPGHMSGPGKELECRCVGKVEGVVTSYNEMEYCTGLNFSYNHLLNLYVNSSIQSPIYKPGSL